jgi:acyl-CoA synthetase (AMP-forming)/AMP-acid ligase II
VETALAKHPGVLAAAVVGIPHERLNEVVAAVIRLQDKWQWEENMSKSDTGSKMLSPNECWGSSQEQIISIHKLQMHCQQLGVSRYACFFPQTSMKLDCGPRVQLRCRLGSNYRVVTHQLLIMFHNTMVICQA